MSECSEGSSPGGSPVAPPPAPRTTAGQKRKAPAKPPIEAEPGSPSMQPSPELSDSEEKETIVAAAPHAAQPVSNQEGETAKRVVIAPVPDGPPAPNGTALLSTQASIGPDETYSKDEETLNTFMKLHPMLSLYAAHLQTYAPPPTHAYVFSLLFTGKLVQAARCKW